MADIRFLIACGYRDAGEAQSAAPHYNFVRIHQTLKITPAMAAGVTSKLWAMSDLVKVLEDWEMLKVSA